MVAIDGRQFSILAGVEIVFGIESQVATGRVKIEPHCLAVLGCGAAVVGDGEVERAGHTRSKVGVLVASSVLVYGLEEEIWAFVGRRRRNIGAVDDEGFGVLCVPNATNVGGVVGVVELLRLQVIDVGVDVCGVSDDEAENAIDWLAFLDRGSCKGGGGSKDHGYGGDEVEQHGDNEI